MLLNFSARGLLVENKKVLFVEYIIGGVQYFSLPGGSLEVGESLAACVQREFAEEARLSVEVKRLVLLNEFIERHPQNAVESWKNGIHQIEAIFELKRLEGEVDTPEQQDFGMQGLQWLSKSDLQKVKYYPEVAIDWFFEEKPAVDLYQSIKRD